MKCNENELHTNDIDGGVRQKIANEFGIPLSILNNQCKDRQYERFLAMHRVNHGA